MKPNKITRIYHHYQNWEDYLNGMYHYETSEQDEQLIEKAIVLLSDQKEFERVTREVLNDWPVATENNLTNIGSNRRSWLGHAACSYKCKVPEILTRIAWGRMSEIAQFEANTVAEKIIAEYERENIGVH